MSTSSHPAEWSRSPGEVGIRLLRAHRAGAGERLARFAIGAESPLFAGHFPHRPLLPGVAQLALVTWTLGGAVEPGVQGHRSVCHQIENLRLRALVHPGDILDVRIVGPEVGGALRFDISRQGDVVTRGAGRWLPPAAAGPPTPAAPATPAASLPSATRAAPAGPPPPPHAWAPGGPSAGPLHLPHAGPALFVRRLLAVAPGEIVCACEIGADHPLAAAGLAPGYLGLEAAAQAAGALAAATAATGWPRTGYLVGVRAARIAPALATGKPFRASAWLEGSAPPLTVYRFAVDTEEGESAAGTLSAFLDAGDQDGNHGLS